MMLARHTAKLLFLSIFFSAVITAQLQASDSRKQDAHTKRHRRNIVPTASSLEDLMNGIGTVTDDMESSEMYRPYTPSTPAPDNINCYVEVPTTTRVGGRCIQLGGSRGRDFRNRPWACQAGLHLEITQDCSRLRQMGRNIRNRPSGRG